MNVSLVIPYIAENQQLKEITEHCIEVAVRNAERDDTQIVLIDNGSSLNLDTTTYDLMARYDPNIGVLKTFEEGYKLATGDIICFIHSDVLLHSIGWDCRTATAFEEDERLGLAGLFGATVLHPNGGRENCMSHMVGMEWGKCGCHAIAAVHHGNLMTKKHPVAMFDGVGLFFRRECLKQLVEETDMFEDWRAPHHFYDRIIGCKVAELGWHMAVLGLQFDHWSGATANSSEKYAEAAKKWLEKNGHNVEPPYDVAIYNIAEQQFFQEYSHRLPLYVNGEYQYTWRQ